MQANTHIYGSNGNANGADAGRNTTSGQQNNDTGAQAQPTAAPLPGALNTRFEREHPPFPRKRDASDNRLPYSYAFGHPTVDDTPLEHTAMPRALALVAEHMPGRAAILDHYYTNKLLKAYRRLCAVRAEEEDKRARHNDRTVQRHQEIDA